MPSSLQPAASGKWPGAEAIEARLRAAGANAPSVLSNVGRRSARVESFAARSFVQEERDPKHRPRWLLSGWACRCRYLADGRRQIFDFVLPGEGMDICLRPRPLNATTVMALTSVELVDASEVVRPEILAAHPELMEALNRIADEDERRLLDQIMRLGRMSALERTAHLFLELHARLSVIGLTDGDKFPLPLTQDTLADILSLSSVHVNRTLQELRRQHLLVVERGQARLQNRGGLEALANRG